jgi:hypothetical protein
LADRQPGGRGRALDRGDRDVGDLDFGELETPALGLASAALKPSSSTIIGVRSFASAALVRVARVAASISRATTTAALRAFASAGRLGLGGLNAPALYGA